MLVHIFATNRTGRNPEKNDVRAFCKTGRMALNALMAISVAYQLPYHASGSR